jgi:hypothetical protein
MRQQRYRYSPHRLFAALLMSRLPKPPLLLH